MIALGVFANNRVVEDLYLREFVQCDYNWPGGEISYEIRTVHNPWLNGKNVIYLGSTRLAGCQAAVDRFVQVLAERPGGSVGSMIEVMKDGQRPTPPTDQEVTSMQKRIKLATTQAAAYGSVSTCANNAFITGEPAWAKLFVQALRKTDELQRTQASVAGPGGYQYAFHCFDCIEEGPAFTDEERLEVTNLLYRFAARLEEAQPDPKWSALTRSVGNWPMAAAFAAQYFSRYYPDLELSKRLLANVDAFYAPDMAAWKPAEDCPYYGQVTVVRSFKWALHRPDRRYVENGSLRKIADYFMLITNNLGERSGFGDYSGLGHGHQHTLVEVYPLAAWLYRDGRYLWWWDHFAEKPTAAGAFWRYRGQGLMGWVPPDVLPRKRPDDLPKEIVASCEDGSVCALQMSCAHQ